MLSVNGASAAEIAYVDDQIKIWTHTGPSTQYKVKHQLTPGTRFEVLQRNEETGFVEIKDELGRVSWLDSKYLTNKPTANRLLVDANKEILRLKNNHTQKVDNLEKRLRELQPLESTNKNLQGELAKLQTDFEQIRQEKQVYEGRFNREVFFSGAVVFIGGMFFGWILSKLGGRKRNSGWN